MNAKAKMTYALIDIAVSKGLKEIKENSGRGLRNLVDLGKRLSKGKHQQIFFQLAQQILDDQSSVYYEIVDRIVQYANPNALKRFGMNLGYNAWTYGAEKIREHEKWRGYNIPWKLIFDFSDHSDDPMSFRRISGLLEEGESLGIYCAIFFIGENESLIEVVQNLAQSHPDSSYFVFLNPICVTEQYAQRSIAEGNIVFVFETSPGTDMQLQAADTADILYRNGCLFGCYSVYDNTKSNEIIGDRFLKDLETLRCPFVFFIDGGLTDGKTKKSITDFLNDAKNESGYSFFLADFYADLAYIDYAISNRDCFLCFQADGCVSTQRMGNIKHGLNAKNDSMDKILSIAMPAGHI